MFEITDQDVELLTNCEIFIFIENAIWGGISVVSHRHAQANNPLVPDYDHKSPHTFINYLDQNNLYGNSMSQSLHTSVFSFLSDADVKSFDLDATTKSDDYGYILEVDLQYPEHLYDAHSDYPLAAEKLLITHDMLSP